MRLFLALSTLLLSVQTFAQNNCDKYATKPAYIGAIKAVAKAEKLSFEQLCTAPKILDIEAQPTHIVTPDGDVIPYVQIQLHLSEQSCLYMVRKSDKSITSNYCYSGS